MAKWQDFIGKSMTQTDVLTVALAQRHAATLDLPMPPQAALPGIHWCLCLPDAPTAQLGADGHPRRDIPGSFLPPSPSPAGCGHQAALNSSPPYRSAQR